MKFFELLYHLLRHLGEDQRWRDMLDFVGMPTLYGILFLIVFCETGLVILPFLPGDSLIFAIGAIGARELGINLPIAAIVLIAAAVLGDAVNYWIGYKLGPGIFRRGTPKLEEPLPSENIEYATPQHEEKGLIGSGIKFVLDKMLNRKHLDRAHEFYEKYGGKTIILARFVPIVRTFAPFVAGVGKMNFFYFWTYNIIGAVAWVLICLFAGYFFGSFDFVKKHFELVIVAVVIISVLPMVVEYMKARKQSKAAKAIPAETSETA